MNNPFESTIPKPTVDEELEWSEQLLKGICPSCSRENGHVKNCIRNWSGVQMTKHDTTIKYEFVKGSVDGYDGPHTVLRFIDLLGLRENMAQYTLLSCKIDAAMFLEKIYQSQSSGEIIQIQW